MRGLQLFHNAIDSLNAQHQNADVQQGKKAMQSQKSSLSSLGLLSCSNVHGALHGKHLRGA